MITFIANASFAFALMSCEKNIKQDTCCESHLSVDVETHQHIGVGEKDDCNDAPGRDCADCSKCQIHHSPALVGAESSSLISTQMANLSFKANRYQNIAPSLPYEPPIA